MKKIKNWFISKTDSEKEKILKNSIALTIISIPTIFVLFGTLGAHLEAKIENNNVLQYVTAIIIIFILLFSVVLFGVVIVLAVKLKKYKRINHHQLDKIQNGEFKPIWFKTKYDPIIEGYYLKWTLREQIAVAQNLYTINNIQNVNYTVIAEPENEFDNTALAIYGDGVKLGYFYNSGNIKDMLRNYLNREDYQVLINTRMLDKENNKLELLIGFYKKINDKKLQVISAILDKVTKRIDYEDRQESLAKINVGDFLEFSKDYDKNFNEIILVTSYDNGNQLGELRKSTITTLEKISYVDIEKMVGKVTEVMYNIDGNFGLRFDIYIF